MKELINKLAEFGDNYMNPNEELTQGVKLGIFEAIKIIRKEPEGIRANDNKYYIVQSFDFPYLREWHIFNNWLSNNKEELVEAVRKDLELNVLLEPVYITEHDNWLFVNNKPEKWLKILEFSKIEQKEKVNTKPKTNCGYKIADDLKF